MGPEIQNWSHWIILVSMFFPLVASQGMDQIDVRLNFVLSIDLLKKLLKGIEQKIK